MSSSDSEEKTEYELIRQGKFALDDNCLAIRAIDQATITIESDARSGGTWAGLLSGMRKRQPRRLAHQEGDSDPRWTLTLDGKLRPPTLKERLKKLEPLPVVVIVLRKNDETVVVSGWAGSQIVTKEIVVKEGQVDEAAQTIVDGARIAFETLDPSETEAIKPMRLKGRSADLMRQISNAMPGSSESAADQEARTITFP